MMLEGRDDRSILIKNADLSQYTTWKVGGHAKQLYKPASLAALQAFLKTLALDEKIIFLGLGSNTLVRAGGVNATVINLQGTLDDMDIQSEGLVYAQAGVACAKLARATARAGLTGLEFLAGIPGTIGGALAMNAGCHGAQTWDSVETAWTINRAGELAKRAPDYFTVGYRYAHIPQEAWFLAASFRTQYAEKTQCLAKIKTLLAHREQTQPTHLPNGGCAFRNPPGDYAGRLIESCGLKGQRIGGAEVSLKHANFIVNTGDATPSDIELLIQHVERTVFLKTGIELQREIKIYGREA